MEQTVEYSLDLKNLGPKENILLWEKIRDIDMLELSERRRYVKTHPS